MNCKVCKNPECAQRGIDFKKQRCDGFIAITNADSITSNVESLAKFIVEIADCAECEEMHGFRMCDAAANKACEDCWLGWLRQEVDNAKDQPAT